MSKELSQEETALKMLRRAKSHGVYNYELAGVRILRYGACLKRLRDDGHNILTERVYLPNGRATGVFRYVLVEEPRKSTWTLHFNKKDK